MKPVGKVQVQFLRLNTNASTVDDQRMARGDGSRRIFFSTGGGGYMRVSSPVACHCGIYVVAFSLVSGGRDGRAAHYTGPRPSARKRLRK